MDDGSIPIGLLLPYLLCLLGSFFFSATEMAFSSVSRVRMRAIADQGNARASRVLSILEDYDSALTALLIGNNIVNIGCATIATVFATRTWGLYAVTAATLITTVVLFIFGESLPKVLAKARCEQVSMLTAGIVSGMLKGLRPLIRVLNAISRALRRPFRSVDVQPTVTEEELRDIIDDAVEGGALNEETGVLVQSAIRYGDAAVRDILTPWKKVQKLPVNTPHEEIVKIMRQSRHSRLPVIDETGDVVGLIRIRRYLKAMLRGKGDVSLQALMEPIHTIPVSMPIDKLLPMMSTHKTHLAFVRDEWDNILGVVTIEDILESLVGDIWDEEDEVSMPAAGGGDA